MSVKKYEVLIVQDVFCSWSLSKNKLFFIEFCKVWKRRARHSIAEESLNFIRK